MGDSMSQTAILNVDDLEDWPDGLNIDASEPSIRDMLQHVPTYLEDPLLELLDQVWDVTQFKPGVKARDVLAAIDLYTPHMIQGLRRYESYWLPVNAAWEQYSLQNAVRMLCVYLLYRVSKDAARSDFVKDKRCFAEEFVQTTATIDNDYDFLKHVEEYLDTASAIWDEFQQEDIRLSFNIAKLTGSVVYYINYRGTTVGSNGRELNYPEPTSSMKKHLNYIKWEHSPAASRRSRALLTVTVPVVTERIRKHAKTYSTGRQLEFGARLNNFLRLSDNVLPHAFNLSTPSSAQQACRELLAAQQEPETSSDTVSAEDATTLPTRQKTPKYRTRNKSSSRNTFGFSSVPNKRRKRNDGQSRKLSMSDTIQTIPRARATLSNPINTPVQHHNFGSTSLAASKGSLVSESSMWKAALAKRFIATAEYYRCNITALEASRRGYDRGMADEVETLLREINLDNCPMEKKVARLTEMGIDRDLTEQVLALLE